MRSPTMPPGSLEASRGLFLGRDGAAVLSLAPWDLEDGSGRDLLLPLVASYFRMGGLHLQLNVLDAAALEAAVASPQDYPELMVRVTGFSAYFVLLSRDVQQDLIARHRQPA